MIVIDASIGFKWLFTINETYLEQASKLLQNHLITERKITVPDLFFYEIDNTVATKTTISPHKTSPLIKKIFELNLTIYHPDMNDLLTATKLAKKYQTSLYDMLYAVISKKNNATLITADENFIQKTGFKFVKHIKSF